MVALIHIETLQVLAVGSVEKTFGGDWGWLQQEGKAVWREMPPDTDVGEILITMPEPGNPVLVVDATEG
jgi:hypothetical protein